MFILLLKAQTRVRTLVRDTLRKYGYTVLEARHGIEALVLAQQHTGPLHLLITDVVMPQMSGRAGQAPLSPGIGGPDPPA